MDLLTNSTVKTPEPETETPNRIQTPKASPFSNGVLKRHAPPHLHHPVVVTYRECLRNHAASLGGHAVDGCGEFMPSANTNHDDPTSLKCAACGCHRNFHRRDPEEPKFPPPNAVPALEFQPYHRHHPPPPPPRANSSGSSPNNSPSPPPISSAYYPNSAPHMLIALSNTPISTPVNPAAAAAPPSNSNSRKRFRTRFNQDQKEKMLQFAERLGWKLQKRDEDVIGDFCSEIGVDKGVFKVWMHNNKNTSGKKDHLLNLTNNSIATSTPPAATSNGAGAHYHHQEASLDHIQDDNGGHDIGTHRSSSSS